MKSFDYSFIERDSLPAKFINIIGSIYELRERMNCRKSQKKLDEKFTDLVDNAKIQFVKYSNMPESFEIADERLNAIISHNSQPIQGDKVEAGISGYHDALNFIYANYDTLDIRGDDILQIHKTLCKNSFESGEYRKTEIPKSDSGIMIRSNTPLPEIVKNMKQLEQAYIDARRNNNINRLLLIPCFILDFLCVSPFHRENESMAMLLSRLLLYKNGFDVVRYISFEEQAYRNPMYQQTLKASLTEQANEDTSHYIQFIEQFITTLQSCYIELDRQFPKMNYSNLPVIQQVEKIINNSSAPITAKKICEILSDFSSSTVEKALGDLVREKIIVKVGTTRNTKYVKK